MRRVTILAVIILGLDLGGGERVAEGGITIDFSEHHNTRMQGFMTVTGAASEYPEGLVTFGGIEFDIPEGGINSWSANAAAGETYIPVSIDVAVGAYGVESVHMLLTTHKGELLPGKFASLGFFGSDAAYHEKSLDGGDDVRDWLFSEYTNTINNVTTVEVFTAGSGYQETYRLDMITIDLPSAFRTQTLETIRVSDWGGVELQRLNVHGITVSAVPEPSSIVHGIVGGALLGSGWWLGRKRGRGRMALIWPVRKTM